MRESVDALPPAARCPHCENVLGVADILIMLEAANARIAARATLGLTSPPGGVFIVPAAAIEWLRAGERGMSSEAIFARLTGIPIESEKNHPHDADDLRRCRALLDAVPEFAARLGEMSDVSERWAKLVKVWPRLCAIMDEETAAREAWRAAGQFGAAPIWNAEMAGG